MSCNCKEIIIDGVVFVPKANVTAATNKDGLDYVIVRTYSAGVFAGYLKDRNGQEVTLFNARRLWSWSGAASLSQLAMEGVKNPQQCKFPVEVDKIQLTQAIEIIPCREKARVSISEVAIWQA